MTNDETIKLILELTGTESVRDAIIALDKMSETAKETGKAEEYLRLQTLQYQAALDSTTDTTDEAVRAAAEQTQSYRLMSQVLDDELNPAMTRTVDTTSDVAHSMGGTPKHGGPSFGRAILQAQYAMDDFSATYHDGGFQRAFASMQNNIPQIALALGAGAGMTGVIGGMAVAASLAIPYIKAFWDELAGRAPVAAEDLKKVNEEWAKLTAKPTKEEAAGGKAIGEAFTAAGYERTADALLGSMRQKQAPEMEVLTDDEQLAFTAAKRRAAQPIFGLGHDKALKRVQDIQNTINERQQHVVRTLMEQADDKGPVGVQARAKLSAIMEDDWKKFAPGLLGDVAAADPGRIKEQQDLEAQGALNAENIMRKGRERQAEVGKTQGEAAKEAGMWRQRLNKMDAGFKDEQQTEGEWNRHLQQMRQQDEREAKRIADKKRHDEERAAKQQQHQQEQAERNQVRMAEANLRESNAQLERGKRLNQEQFNIGNLSHDLLESARNMADQQIFNNNEQMRRLQQSAIGGAQFR